MENLGFLLIKKKTFYFSDSKLNFENIDERKEIFNKIYSQHSPNRENKFLGKKRKSSGK